MKTTVRPRIRDGRSGYALLLVLAFIAFLFSMYSLSHRHVASLIRTEHARLLIRERESGTAQALAMACDLLETGQPPTDPYECAVVVQTISGSRSFTVRFDVSGRSEWTIRVRPTEPGESPSEMPPNF